MALLALDSVAVQLRWPIPAYPLVGEKADGSLHQENNYIKKKMGEARSFSFSHYASIPVGSINLALGYSSRPAQTKVKPPSWRMGKMTFSAGLLTHPRSSLLKKSEPPAEI